MTRVSRRSLHRPRPAPPTGKLRLLPLVHRWTLIPRPSPPNASQPNIQPAKLWTSQQARQVNSREDLQRFRFVSLDGCAWLERLESRSIFCQLISNFKVPFIGPVLIVLAFVRGVVSADLRTRFVDATTVVCLQVLAFGVDQQIPSLTLCKDRCRLVDQVPANKVKISLGCRCVNGQRKVTATLGSAVIAQGLTGLQFTASDFF